MNWYVCGGESEQTTVCGAPGSNLDEDGTQFCVCECYGPDQEHNARRIAALPDVEAEVATLREAMKGATIVANHASSRIKELEDALTRIRDISTADCAEYVRIADEIACEALAA